jgi:isochorismate hydrolase
MQEFLKGCYVKELYYNNNSIDKQANAFLEKITPLRNKHSIQIHPSKVALLVMDFQKFFIDENSHACVPSARTIIPSVLKLQNHCLQNKIMVIQTFHTVGEKDNMMSKWWHKSSELLIPEVIPELSNPKAKMILKNQYDAFYNTDLESILKKNGIEQLIITGIMTHLCCETTARSAFVRGYETFFSIDGTATYNREFHLGSLINLAHGFAIPMLTSEIMNQLKDYE